MSGTNTEGVVNLIQQRCDALQATVLHHVSDSRTLELPGLDLPLPGFVTVHALMVVLAAVLLAGASWLALRKRRDVPTGWANLLEAFVVFVRDRMVVPYLGEEDGRRMTPLFCTFFFFILTMNLIGLVPSLYSATANLSVTSTLGLISLWFMVMGAIYKNGLLGFLKGFVPAGVPWPLLILLVPIEIVGVFIRAFALMIRLFANMLAGHMVLLFMVGMLLIFGLAALPFLGLAFLVYIMEIGVAFLQAYIFTLLSAIFIGQRYHPEH